MSFLSNDSKDIAQLMELSLFASPSNQVAVEKLYYTEARPISNISSMDTVCILCILRGRIHRSQEM